jgi:hypothetical protein
MPKVPHDLYVVVAQASFALLGLWWVVVQFRHAEWMADTVLRRAAHGISLHFLLPGLMSVMALAAPEHTAVWRISFCAAALIGAAEALRRLGYGRGESSGRASVTGLVVLVVAYLVVALLALAPSLLSDLGIGLRPLEAEGMLVGILLFAGANLAWLAFSEPIRR